MDAVTFVKLGHAFEQLAEAGDRANTDFRRLGNALQHWKSCFESSLTFREMKRYLRLQKDHPDLTFDELAEVVRPSLAQSPDKEP